MKILFDQGTPAPLARHLTNHSVNSVFELGWSSLANGLLRDAAEQAEYELLITTDQNLRYQQNLSKRKIAILVLMSTSWLKIRLRIETIQSAVNDIKSSEYREFPI